MLTGQESWSRTRPRRQRESAELSRRAWRLQGCRFPVIGNKQVHPCQQSPRVVQTLHQAPSQSSLYLLQMHTLALLFEGRACNGRGLNSAISCSRRSKQPESPRQDGWVIHPLHCSSEESLAGGGPSGGYLESYVLQTGGNVFSKGSSLCFSPCTSA